MYSSGRDGCSVNDEPSPFQYDTGFGSKAMTHPSPDAESKRPPYSSRTIVARAPLVPLFTKGCVKRGRASADP